MSLYTAKINYLLQSDKENTIKILYKQSCWLKKVQNIVEQLLIVHT